MRAKILTALVAGGLLVGAGLLTSVVSAPGAAQAQEETGSLGPGGPIPRLLGFIGDVLDGLVGDGTITQEQADAIADAAETKVEEVREEHVALLELTRDLIEDGVVTEEEASELPDDHWFLGDVFDQAWEDGELSVEEIRELKPRRGHPFRHGMRFGALLDDGGIDQEEYDGLGEEHPLKQLDVGDYLEDGLITPGELREIFTGLIGAGSGEDT